MERCRDKRYSALSTPNTHFLPLLSLLTLASWLRALSPLALWEEIAGSCRVTHHFQSLCVLPKKIQRAPQHTHASPPDPNPHGVYSLSQEMQEALLAEQSHSLPRRGSATVWDRDDREPPPTPLLGARPQFPVQGFRGNTELIANFDFYFLETKKLEVPFITFKCYLQSWHSKTHLWLN